MNENLKKAKELMEEGWKTRENHDFSKADELLLQAKNLFEKEGDWYNVTECLNHLSYNKKMMGEKLIMEGYETAKSALKIAQEHSTKKVLIYRSLLSLSISLGLYEISERYAKKFLSEMTKEADRVDVMTHIAQIYLRTGNVNKAVDTINEAKTLLEKNLGETTQPHGYIWQTKTLMTESLVEYNRGNKKLAEKLAREALEIAKKQNLKTRMDQANLVIEAINGDIENN